MITTSMDIVVCFDCSSSITSYSNRIRESILSIFNNGLVSENDIRMGLIEFQSHTDKSVPKVHPFTSSMNTFQEWINAIQTEGENSNGCKAVVDALDAALKLKWRPNDNTDRFHEKLVILITDGPPCNLLNNECPCDSNDLWRMSNEFEKQDITIVVIGIEPSVVVCDDFYCALANKTGGEYIPLVNASHVLSFVIKQAILGEDTLSQLFRQLHIQLDIEYNSSYHYSHVQERARFMIEYCKTMTDIRKRLFTHRYQSTGSVIGRTSIHGSNFDGHTPTSSIDDFDHLSENTTVFTSTPITDDEGYRTRLPTTASNDSSFIDIIPYADLDWNSEIDDDIF